LVRAMVAGSVGTCKLGVGKWKMDEVGKFTLRAGRGDPRADAAEGRGRRTRREDAAEGRVGRVGAGRRWILHFPDTSKLGD